MSKKLRICKPKQYRQIDELTPHPLQGKVLLDISEAELQTLADDIERNGQLHPIEITTDNLIVDGHQRVAALKSLGETKVWVRVPKLLDTPEKVEARFIEANLHRRQLDTLGRVRAVKRLLALRNDDDTKPRPLDKRIADRLGIDDRTVRRYLKVLETPLPVQQAMSAGQLRLVDAEKVARLDPKQQDRIGEKIANGEEPKGVVHESLRPKRAKKGDKNTRATAIKPILSVVQRATALALACKEVPEEVEISSTHRHTIEATRDQLEQLLDKHTA